jgi:hypothetical protein
MVDLPHIQVRSSRSESYSSPRRGDAASLPTRDRHSHADHVLGLITRLEEEAETRAISDGFIIAFDGPGIEDSASRLRDRKTKNEVLATTPLETVLVSTEGDLSALRKKVAEYKNEDTRKGNPRHEQLVARIDDIRIATLRDLSFGDIRDDEVEPDKVYFVELWLSFEDEFEAYREPYAAFLDSPDFAQDLQHIASYAGVDREVDLIAIRGSALLRLPTLMPYLAEVHVPPAVRLREVSGSIEHSKGLPPVSTSDSYKVAVAVHDTGVDPRHPLLEPVLLGAESAIPGGSPHDWHGHGTRMSGLAVYGDLSEQVLLGKITPAAALISVEYLEPGERGDVLWAERTQLAIEIAEDVGRGHKIVHSISMGAANPREHESTSWSTALDRAAWNGGEGRLIVVAAGNLEPVALPERYPSENLASPLSQPGQAWNAITVSGITELSTLSATDLRLGATTALALPGQLSPFSTAGPVRLAPSKPDVVAEAGNTAPDGVNANPDLIGLSVLTTASRTIGTDLTRSNATSAATAITANALARIWTMYPDFRPATVRALLAHSSRVPTAIISQLDGADVRRAVGHGQFSLDRATKSSETRPVMVFEGTVRPKSIDIDKQTSREIVFIQIPFPTDLMMSVSNQHAVLDVTLSYFVEPSERDRRSKYAGARLRWDMQGPDETPEEFQARINVLSREDDHVTQTQSYKWHVGADNRSRSSLQHDWTDGPASNFAGPRLIAVYPVLGWWDQRKSYESRVLPFSLVASIEVSADIDIYSPISASLDIDAEVDVDVDVEVDV